MSFTPDIPPCDLTELVGTAKLDTIGLVIANGSPTLKQYFKGGEDYSSFGVISSRTGAAGQILAVDEAVKATNAEVVAIELPRDTKGWGGHGNYIVIGARSVSDTRRAVEMALPIIDRNAGEVYISDAGHLEFAFSASAGEALSKAFGAPVGQAFGFMAGSPAAIGLVMADRALKAAEVEVLRYMTPDHGTSHSNEVILAFCGTASAVKESVLTAREVGQKLLNAMGSVPASPGDAPYIR